MEKVIFFALAVPILGFVFYLGGTAIMKGFKAKVENKPAKPEEKEEENETITFSIIIKSIICIIKDNT